MTRLTLYLALALALSVLGSPKQLGAFLEVRSPKQDLALGVFLVLGSPPFRSLHPIKVRDCI